MKAEGVFSEELQCFWRSWSVLAENILRLELPPGSCTDMSGAIRVAKVLLPDVAAIYVFGDGKPDICYARLREDEPWQAFYPQPETAFCPVERH